MTLTVAALYQFVPFDDPAAYCAPLKALCVTHGVKGMLRIAHEGVNGTIAGRALAVEAVLAHIRALPGCEALEVTYATAAIPPFQRMKVRLTAEIVTLGVANIDPSRDVGRYVDPADWNALIADPATIVIDTRNDFEVSMGTFDGALNPDTTSFSAFPDWFRANRARFGPDPRVAMFCTGGIRCEKSTAFLRAEGVADVAHLKGGILAYLKQVPASESRWRGECFVFDERVSVGQGLSAGTHTLCRACRMPLSREDRANARFVEGVQCHHCAARRTDDERARYAERHRQMALANTRGYAHLGDAAAVVQGGSGAGR